MSDNISNLSFEELYNEMCNSYVEGNETMNIVSNIISDIEEATSSSNKSRRKRSYIERGREEGHTRIWNDYFSNDPIYTNNQFRRRFRMRKELFLRIVNALENHDSYFENTFDGIGRKKISSIQKCTAAIRMLSYGIAGDAVDDYVRMSGNTAIQCLKKFNECIIDVFGGHYLRKPTTSDIERLLQIGENRGFPGMLGSIDCMHWRWEKCPTAWHGMFTRGDQGKPTMILEAVASNDLWIWHAYFGIAGSNNDINVLDRSPLFDEFVNGRGPNVQFTVNECQYNMGYYLADGIYPEWPVFVKTIPQAHILSEKRRVFAKHQESVRKDIERAFGVLKKRFAIIANPARFWKRSEVGDIMKTCIILHNMIVDDERDETDLSNDFQYDIDPNHENEPEITNGVLPNYYAHREQYFENHRRIRNRIDHHQLQADLVEHIWQHLGN